MDYREYLDQLLKDAVALAENVTDATRQKFDQASTRLEIKKQEVELDKAYRSLGRLMYQIEKGTLKRDDLIVDAAMREVDDLENKIAALKEKAKKESGGEAAEEVGQPAEEPEAEDEQTKAGEPEEKAPEAEEEKKD